MTIMGFKKSKDAKKTKRRTKKTDIKGGLASKAWRLFKGGMDFTEIGKEVGFTSISVKRYIVSKCKKEATEIWAKEIKAVGHCEINDAECQGDLNAHHLLEKSTWVHLRCDLSNGICLCSSHHQFHTLLSPHANTVSAENFTDWLREFRSGQHKWYEEHKNDKQFQDINWIEEWERLSK